MSVTGPERTSPDGDGRLWLSPALMGGVLVLAAAGLLIVGAVLGLPALGLGTAGADRVDVTTAAGTAPANVLEVGVRGPTRLVLGRPSPLEVRAGGLDTVRTAATGRLQVTLDLDLDAEARGWVVVDPPRLLTTTADLTSERITVTGFGGLPCAERVGTLTVTVRELEAGGRTGTAIYDVPGACPDGDVPGAPESLDITQRVWSDGHNDWRAQVQRILSPPPAPAPRRPAPRAPAPEPEAPEPEDPGEEPEEEDEEPEEPAKEEKKKPEPEKEKKVEDEPPEPPAEPEPPRDRDEKPPDDQKKPDDEPEE